MSTNETRKNIELFERKFLFDITSEALKMTEENMFTQPNPYDGVVESMMVQKTHQQNNQNIIFQRTESIMQQNNQQQISIAKKHNKVYNLKTKKFLVEIIVGYTITMAFMYLNKVVYFPFFEALMIIIIALSIKSPKKVNLLILLSIPMAIANYNLGVWVLTYPEIIICYFSTYAFTQKNYLNLLWIFSTIIFALFGFILIAKVGQNSPTAKMVLYYIYPFLLLLVKTIGALINQFLSESSLFLLQIPFFLTGLSYGMILTLNKSNVQFWYLLIILTIQIINSRYQFLLRLILHLAKVEQWVNIAEAQSSGHASIHCYHLVFFVYAVSYLQLNSSRFFYDMLIYIDDLYKPFIVWIFFITYETVSILKLRKRQNLIIIGYKNNSWTQSAKRGLGVGLGLWFFYMGLGIPSNFSRI